MKASATIAAVARIFECRGKQRNVPDQEPVEQMAEHEVQRLGSARWPPNESQISERRERRNADQHHAANTATSLAAMSVAGRYGSCTKSRSAPVSFSWPSTRIATNGNSKVIAT